METEPAGGAAHLTRALARDLDGSFERLVVAHQDRLYTIALRMLGDSRDAEEVTQDALVRAYRALGGYDAQRILELQLRPWLTTIVLNACRNRTRRRGPLSQPLEGDDERPGPAARLISNDRAGSPHDAAVHRESARRWASLVGGLSPSYRAAIVLRHVDGLSYAEMSIVLGRPEGTLKAQVHRGLALLRVALEQADTTERREMTA
jgi:RNA polymerase sigma-70 factor (ECF subfamily)